MPDTTHTASQLASPASASSAPPNPPLTETATPTEYPALDEFKNKQNRKQKIQTILLLILILLLIGVSINLIFQYQKAILENI